MTSTSQPALQTYAATVASVCGITFRASMPSRVIVTGPLVGLAMGPLPGVLGSATIPVP